MARSSSVVGLNGDGSALSGDDFTSSSLTPSLSISPVTSGNWISTPIEPTIDDLARNDMVGGAGDHVAGGGGKRADLRDDRLFRGQQPHLVVDRFATGGGAAGRIDRQDDALDGG